MVLSHAIAHQIIVGASVDRDVKAGMGDILMDDVACSGSELRLIDCEHASTSNCFHFEDVGVTCNTFGQSCVPNTKMLKFRSIPITHHLQYPLTCVRVSALIYSCLPTLLSLLVYMVRHMTTLDCCWHAPNPYNQQTYIQALFRRQYKTEAITGLTSLRGVIPVVILIKLVRPIYILD